MPKKKKPTAKELLIAGAAYFLIFAGSGVEKIGGGDNDNVCGGKERWPQKVMADAAANSIDETPVDTTIEGLNKINTTLKDTKYKENGPRMGIESRIYRIKNCFITDVLREDDNDLHLVIEDGHKHTMIAEIPDPNCPDAKNSLWGDDFRKVRKTLEENAGSYRHYLFTITGPLFVDRFHNQTGSAPNNTEIHPIISIKRGKRINPIPQ